jgi:L-threonylcarbamoyladenylate synthase
MPEPAPDSALLAAAVAALSRGALVVFPTETVYGLGADASDERAVLRIYALKGRPATHPVIVHLAAGASLAPWAAQVNEAARALAAAFWPGPLTLVLPRARGVLDQVTGGQDTVALRVPAHPLAQRLLAAFGGGLAAPSANRYGRLSPTTAAHVREEFGCEAPLIIDGGPCAIGLESTIVACLAERPRLLRPGAIERAALEAVVGPLALEAGGVRAPGGERAHYAPRTRVELQGAPLVAAELFDAAVLARQRAPAAYRGPRWIAAPAEARAYAHELYASLHTLDATGAGRIVVERVPEEPAWIAVADRLQRAAAAAEQPIDGS